MNKNIIRKFEKIFWIFMIGSIIGYITEMIVALVQKGHFESRQGLLYGPFAPVYGIGMLVYYIFFEITNIKDKKWIFLSSMLLGGIAEYICSLVQEKVFGTISWDYSTLPLNINGRTSLLHCTYWGIAGVLYVLYIKPLTYKIEGILKKKSIQIATFCFIILIALNIMISTMASIRQKERRQLIEPRNKIERVLDKYYPDEYMDRIFANKINKITERKKDA